VILAVALGLAVIVAVAAVLRVRALSRQVAELHSRADGAEAKVAAGLEREVALEERHTALAAEQTAMETSLQEQQVERERLERVLRDTSGEVDGLTGELMVLRADLANAQEAAREADAAAVAAVAQADATHDDLVAARTDAEQLRTELDELKAVPPAPSDDERPEASPLLVEGLWSLERTRTERTWRQSVALDPSDPGPFEAHDDPARVAIEVEAAAVREEVGSVITVDWQVDGALPAADGLLLVRSAQELLAVAARTVEEGVLAIARDGDDLVVSLLDADGGAVDLDGSVVRLPLVG